jgi:hypothetical protein
MAALYDHIRQAPVVKREVPVATGEIDAAFASAARIVEAEYEWPFQSHASMGPACAIVDARADGATLWTGSQKPHFARDGVARALGLPQDKVHGIWVPGPGSYGRNDAGDAGIDAALLSKAVGRPVRVQGMRYEGHGWDPKGPASIHRARAALDKDGAVIGYVLESKGFSRIDIDTNESDPSKHIVLLSSLLGYYSFGSRANGFFITCATSLHKRDEQITSSHFAPLRSFGSAFPRQLLVASYSETQAPFVSQDPGRSERRAQPANELLPGHAETNSGDVAR